MRLWLNGFLPNWAALRCPLCGFSTSSPSPDGKSRQWLFSTWSWCVPPQPACGSVEHFWTRKRSSIAHPNLILQYGEFLERKRNSCCCGSFRWCVMLPQRFNMSSSIVSWAGGHTAWSTQFKTGLVADTQHWESQESRAATQESGHYHCCDITSDRGEILHSTGLRNLSVSGNQSICSYFNENAPNHQFMDCFDLIRTVSGVYRLESCRDVWHGTYFNSLSIACHIKKELKKPRDS